MCAEACREPSGLKGEEAGRRRAPPEHEDAGGGLRARADLVAILGELYDRYDHREFVHPDPLEFLYDFQEVADREVAGVVASSLAFGRVAHILKSVSTVLGAMGPSPAGFLSGSSRRSLERAFSGFRHRWTTGEQVAGALTGVRNVIREHGSLEACFLAGFAPDDGTVVPALCAFSRALSLAGGYRGASCEYLLPSPEKGSACKRLNLFLRWMVRRDGVDPGGWTGVPASKLVIPLDTHMHRIGLALGITRRKNADMRAALEMTAAFAEIAPEDPVRYDFCLTRLGMRGGVALEDFLSAIDEAQCSAG